MKYRISSNSIIADAPTQFHHFQTHDKYSQPLPVFSWQLDESVHNQPKRQKGWRCSRHKIDRRRF